MRSSQVEALIGYLRFSIESEGEEMGESREDTYSDILSGDISIEEAIKSFEEKKNLKKSSSASDNLYGIKDDNIKLTIQKMSQEMRGQH